MAHVPEDGVGLGSAGSDLRATTYNDDGHIPANAPKKIELFEVLDKTASAKLTANWGVDYFHLAKVDGKWQIMNVLWQSQPEN